MSVDLTGQSLASVRCEAALELVTADGWYLTVENDYTWESAEGTVLYTQDGDEPRIVSEIERSVDTTVTSFAYDEHGEMSLGLTTGVLRVSSSADFESWNIVGPERQRVVSMPGGELAVWS